MEGSSRKGRRNVACDECKRRKIRCSADPDCANCARDGKTCVYSSPVYRVTALQRSAILYSVALGLLIWSLLMRLRQLQRNEAYLVKVKKAWQRHVPGISLEQAVSGIDDPTPTIGARTEDTAIPQGVRSIIHEEPSLATPDSTTSPAEQRNAEDYEFDESEDFNEAIDGMGFLTLESQKSGYTGPQSGIAAMCFLRSLPNDLELVQDVEPSAYPADSIPSHKSSPTAVNIDETINDYFALFHPAYPLLHEGLFRAQMAGRLTSNTRLMCFY